MPFLQGYLMGVRCVLAENVLHLVCHRLVIDLDIQGPWTAFSVKGSKPGSKLSLLYTISVHVSAGVTHLPLACRS